MSRNRFKELVRCIRFDDMSTRATRKGGEQGRIAPIHELWEKFIEACKKNYSAGCYGKYSSFEPGFIFWL